MAKRRLDPLPSAAFHILVALAGEDLHGYAIMRQVSALTGGRVRLGPGTLYGSIKTLLEASLIAELDERAADDSAGERRRYYRLTAAGRKLARAEAERLAGMIRVARTAPIPNRRAGCQPAPQALWSTSAAVSISARRAPVRAERTLRSSPAPRARPAIQMFFR